MVALIHWKNTFHSNRNSFGMLMRLFVSQLNHRVEKNTHNLLLLICQSPQSFSLYSHLLIDRFYPTKSINHEAVISFYGVIKFYGQAIACPSIHLFKTINLHVDAKNCTFVEFVWIWSVHKHTSHWTYTVLKVNK